MDSLHTSNSKWRFLDLTGSPIESPSEWMPALVELSIPLDQWSKTEFRLQGKPVPVYIKRLMSRECVLVDWPRSGPGNYRLELLSPTETNEHIITIWPKKIDSLSFTQMLEDLEVGLPAAIAVGLQLCGALTGVKLLPPSESTINQEVMRLRRAVEGTSSYIGLVDVIAGVARDPHQVLGSADYWVKMESARRPNAVGLVQALSRGHNLSADKRPLKLLDDRVDHTFDVYENRLVKMYFEQVRQRLHHLLHLVEAKRRPEVHGVIYGLLHQLTSAWRQASFMESVSLPTHLPTRLTMVLLKRHLYRAALEGFLEFHKSVSAELVEPALETPLENLPYLYQMWNMLEVLNALLQVASELGYRVTYQRLVRKLGDSVYVQVLPDGQPVVTLTHPTEQSVVRVIPECAYGKTGRLYSVSYQQIPDVAVELDTIGGPVRVYLFDPKYKQTRENPTYEDLESDELDENNNSGRPQKWDIDKMHAYRDAIRDEHNNRVVEYAAIMYPGKGQIYTPGIEALRAYPGDTQPLAARLKVLFRDLLNIPSANLW